MLLDIHTKACHCSFHILRRNNILVDYKTLNFASACRLEIQIQIELRIITIVEEKSFQNNCSRRYTFNTIITIILY